MRVSRGITQLLMVAATSPLQLRRYIFKSCKALAWTISTAFLVMSEKCEKKEEEEMSECGISTPDYKLVKYDTKI